MNKDHASTLPNELNRGLLGFLRPFSTVVIEYDCLMISLEWIPIFPCSVICLLVFFVSRFLGRAKVLVGIFQVLGCIRFWAPDSLDGFGLGCGFHFQGKTVCCLQRGM